MCSIDPIISPTSHHTVTVNLELENRRLNSVSEENGIREQPSQDEDKRLTLL